MSKVTECEPMVDDMFIREDLTKPENRVNLALFSLMAQDWFREWFLGQLGLPENACIYPSKGCGGKRPDFAVVDVSGNCLAYIEVELGTDSAQVQGYEEEFDEPIKTVWGKKSHGGDLSLEEIQDKLDAQACLSPQVNLNVLHLHLLIDDGLDGHSGSSKPVNVSEKMQKTPFVSGLRGCLGEMFEFTAKAATQGRLVANARGDDGFSLRAPSNVAGRDVSILNVQGGQKKVRFSNRSHLLKYLPDHGPEIETFEARLGELGCDLRAANPSLSLERAIDAVEEIANCVKAFAK